MTDSSAFSIQSSLDANYLNISLTELEELDETAIKTIKEDCPDFLIPFHLMNINDSNFLKYKLMNAVSLEYSSLTMTKNMFAEMYFSLLTPFVTGKDWFLDYHYLCINPTYVYCSRDLKKSFFIYIPAKSYRNGDKEILGFFQNVLNNVTITDESGFMVKLYQYFNRGNVTLAELYRMVREECKNEGSAEHKVIPAEHSAVSATSAIKQGVAMQTQPDYPVQQLAYQPEKTDEKQQKKKNLFGSSEKKKKEKEEMAETAIPPFTVQNPDFGNLEGDEEVIAALFGDNKKKTKEKKEKKEKPIKEKPPKKEKSRGFFGSRKKQEDLPQSEEAIVQNSISYSQPQIYPMVQNMDAITQEDDGVTEILDDGMMQKEEFLSLIESPVSGAPVRISLGFDKPFITLGRMSNNAIKPDVAFSSDLKGIGRMHARIEKKNGVFYAIDLGSANHTFVNGQMLVPNTPWPLKNGDELTLTSGTPVRYRVNL